MKKSILFYSCIYSFIFFSFISCKKITSSEELYTKVKVEKKTPIHVNLISSFSNRSTNLTINSNGFLAFDSIADLENFHDFLATSTHAQVQAYLDSIGFISIGKSKYASNSASVTSIQQIYYALSTDSIVQVEGVILRPTQNLKFLFAMLASNLDRTTYSSLASGYYDSSSMDKFATDPDVQASTGLIEFVKSTPTGHTENTARTTASGKPFWGTSCTSGTEYIFNAYTGEYDAFPWTYCCHYIFWINTGCHYVDP